MSTTTYPSSGKGNRWALTPLLLPRTLDKKLDICVCGVHLLQQLVVCRLLDV